MNPRKVYCEVHGEGFGKQFRARISVNNDDKTTYLEIIRRSLIAHGWNPDDYWIIGSCVTPDGKELSCKDFISNNVDVFLVMVRYVNPKGPFISVLNKKYVLVNLE